jgi:hypothetical protein
MNDEMDFPADPQGPVPVWKSSASEDDGESSMSRRCFLRSSGGASAAAVFAWHGLQTVAEAKFTGGSGA